MADITRTPRIDLASAGIAVGYAFETTANTRPTGFYTHIPGITSIPDMNESPNMINTTTLDELTEEVGVPGLKALPSATSFEANFTEALDKQWDDIMSKYATAKASGLRMWLVIVIPNVTNAFFYPVEPSALDAPPAGVSEVLSINLYLTKVGEKQRGTAPEIQAWEAPTP